MSHARRPNLPRAPRQTAAHFWLLHVLSRWEAFLALVTKAGDTEPGIVAARFPFTEFFSNAPGPLFSGTDVAADMRRARGCFRHLQTMFTELEECRSVRRAGPLPGPLCLPVHAAAAASWVAASA